MIIQHKNSMWSAISSLFYCMMMERGGVEAKLEYERLGVVE